MSKTRRPALRFATSAAEVVAYLKANDYPFEWDEDLLARSCLSVSIRRGEDVLGYLWLHWVRGADHVLELHICIGKAHLRRWLCRSLVEDFKTLCGFTGARTVLARPSCDAHRDYLTRLGFSPHGIFSVLSLSDP